MEKSNIFGEIMNLIEKNTDIPLLAKDVEKWLKEEKENADIYNIYKIASSARNLE